MSEVEIDLDTPVGHVDGFNYRALGRFRYAEIKTLRELVAYNEEDLSDIRAMGTSTLANVKAVLADLGLELAKPH